MMFISGDLLPLSTVESPGFQHFVAELKPRYAIPSHTHLPTKLLKKKMTNTLNRVKTDLKRAQCVCLTIDMWSNRQMRSYLGITLHYITQHTSPAMLACKRFSGRHTAETIHQEYEEAIACFDIATKIHIITTDSAANMIKAFALPGYSSEPPEDSEDEDPDDSVSVIASADSTFEMIPERLSCLPTPCSWL